MLCCEPAINACTELSETICIHNLKSSLLCLKPALPIVIFYFCHSHGHRQVLARCNIKRRIQQNASALAIPPARETQGEVGSCGGWGCLAIQNESPARACFPDSSVGSVAKTDQKRPETTQFRDADLLREQSILEVSNQNTSNPPSATQHAPRRAIRHHKSG